MNNRNATCFGHIRPSSGNTFIRSLMHCPLIESFSYAVNVFISFLKCGCFFISMVCCFLDCVYQVFFCVLNATGCSNIILSILGVIPRNERKHIWEKAPKEIIS
jgi:hypothetical protein